MSATFYVNGVTVIDAAPMNDYDSATYDNFGDGTNYTGVLASARMASVYQYTAWDPSDVAGTLTSASSTAGATSTATNYVTVANSSGTLTFTCVKAGSYRFTVNMNNESAATTTRLLMFATLSGTGAAGILLGTAGTLTLCDAATISSSQQFSGVFYAVLTAAQTITILPRIGVTSAGVTTQFTQQCTVSAEYTGT